MEGNLYKWKFKNLMESHYKRILNDVILKKLQVVYKRCEAKRDSRIMMDILY